VILGGVVVTVGIVAAQHLVALEIHPEDAMAKIGLVGFAEWVGVGNRSPNINPLILPRLISSAISSSNMVSTMAFKTIFCCGPKTSDARKVSSGGFKVTESGSGNG
jgi:hypothetical protein